MFHSVVRSLLGSIALIALAVGPVHAQLDFAILDAEIVDGAHPDSINLVLTMGVLTPQEGSWNIPTRLLFNGIQTEPNHTLNYVKGRLNECPQAPPNCPNPNPPCGRTVWGYKNRGPFTENWPCLFNSQTHRCDCVEPGLPVAQKPIPRPNQNGFFDILIDPDDLFPESNEQNNKIRVFYQTPVSVEESGTISELRLVAPTPSPTSDLLRYGIQVPRAMHVELGLYDVRGRRVDTLLDNDLAAGDRSFLWRPDEVPGERLENGVYYLVLEGGGMRHSVKVTLVR